ncbi:hypothetical protein AAFF_G00284310 [Aldrovandia affinis]|uniref:Uncharacterized protein n=1 Tax=Aldrovandia affinis TaxID=143900 RepID=A0AAD7TA62_9TELE|nr:hypothetical protein AAFF_G00284310 [Aldrovandia affinis]
MAGLCALRKQTARGWCNPRLQTQPAAAAGGFGGEGELQRSARAVVFPQGRSQLNPVPPSRAAPLTQRHSPIERSTFLRAVLRARVSRPSPSARLHRGPDLTQVCPRYAQECLEDNPQSKASFIFHNPSCAECTVENDS